MIKNIIFDWSGVLSDSLITGHCAAMTVLNTFGVKKLSLKEFRKEWEQPYMIFYNRYIPHLSLEEERKIYQKALSSCPKPKPYPGTKKVLQNFKKNGIKMAILSSDPQKVLFAEVKKYGLDGIFDEIMTDSHDKTEVVQEIIMRNSFNPKETIFVGDTTHEVNAGKAAGIKTVAVTWGFSNEDKLKQAKPDYIIHNLKELELIIL